MKVSLILACFFLLAAMPNFADVVLYQGTFADDGDFALLSLNVTSTEVISIQSWGYAGGTVPTQPAPTSIAAGGFAPNLLLFDPTGVEIASDSGGHCGTTASDPVTGNCDDPFLQESLTAGSYTIAVLEWDNVSSDGLLADGFTQQGNSGFTCAEFGQTGNFCDVTTAFGTVRDGNWAVSVTSSGATSTPEPSALAVLLLFIGFGYALALTRPGTPQKGIK